MKTLIHGTTAESSKDIQQNGFATKVEQTWSCSVGETSYFYDTSCFDELSEAYEAAMGNAQIAAAIRNSQNKDLHLIELTMSDDVHDQFRYDISCGDAMPMAVEIDNDTLNKLIADGDITMKIIRYDESYIPLFRLFYLFYVPNNLLSDEDPDLLRALSMLDNSKESFIDHGLFDDIHPSVIMSNDLTTVIFDTNDTPVKAYA